MRRHPFTVKGAAHRRAIDATGSSAQLEAPDGSLAIRNASTEKAAAKRARKR